VAVGGNNAYAGDRISPSAPPVPVATKPAAGPAEASHDGVGDYLQQMPAQPNPQPAHVSRIKRLSAKAQKWLQR